MIESRKQKSNATDSRKSLRLNLGGLLKRRISWKRSLDALTSSFNELEFDKKQSDKSRDVQTSPIDICIPSLDTAYTAAPQQHMLRHQSSSLDLSGGYVPFYEDSTSFRTECISLQNSDMTSAMSEQLMNEIPYRMSELDLFPISRVDDMESYEEVDEEDGEVDDEEVDDEEDDEVDDETEHFNASLEEPIRDYKTGGYHPVKIGDQYSSDTDTYKIVQKLGWGHFSTVWLCVSVMTGDQVAMKIVKSSSTYADAARDEICILKLLQNQDEDDIGCAVSQSLPTSNGIINLLDDFQITGPNGTHLAMVFELMAENLFHMVYNIRKTNLAAGESIKSPVSLLPMSKVKCVVKQILHSVNYMHQQGVIHTDIKPENVLLIRDGDNANKHIPAYRENRNFQILPSKPLSNFTSAANDCLKVKIADLGNATYSSLHFTDNIQTRQYRAPEIILKYKSWGASADIWSIGCLTFELLTGDYLFDPKQGDEFSKDDDHLAQIIELTGTFPSPKYLSNCELSATYFKDSNTMRNIHSLKFWPLKRVLTEKYGFSSDDDEVDLFCDFLAKCLRYDLNERFDCASLLAHPWFRDTPKFDQSECDALPNNNQDIIGFTCEE